MPPVTMNRSTLEKTALTAAGPEFVLARWDALSLRPGTDQHVTVHRVDGSCGSVFLNPATGEVAMMVLPASTALAVAS